MAIDLFSLAKEALGDGLMGQLGEAVGENPDVMQKAVDSGIPAILGGLLGKAGSNSGLGEILGQVQDSDDGLLDNLTDGLFGANKSNLLQTGASILGMLFGAKQNGILGTLTNMVGMRNSGTASSLLGMLAPVVFGLIKKKLFSSNNLNADGLQSLLSDQKDLIADKLPTEMRDSLGISDLFNAPTAAAVETSVQETKSGLSRFLPWLAIGAAVLLGLMFFGGQDNPAPVQTQQSNPVVTPQPAAPQPAAPTVIPSTNTQSLGQQLAGLADGLTDINSVDDAMALTGQFDNVGGYLDSLNVDEMGNASRDALRPSVATGIEALNRAAASINDIPGVGPILQPRLEALLDKLKSI